MDCIRWRRKPRRSCSEVIRTRDGEMDYVICSGFHDVDLAHTSTGSTNTRVTALTSTGAGPPGRSRLQIRSPMLTGAAARAEWRWSVPSTGRASVSVRSRCPAGNGVPPQAVPPPASRRRRLSEPHRPVQGQPREAPGHVRKGHGHRAVARPQRQDANRRRRVRNRLRIDCASRAFLALSCEAQPQRRRVERLEPS